MNDGYRCELCGAWVEYGNLSQVRRRVEKERGVGNPSAPNPVLNNRRWDQRHVRSAIATAASHPASALS